jgi:RNA polymerase sigma-70 factor, ECF subfamily
MIERTNEEWLNELKSDGAGQTQAIEDLRQYLRQRTLIYLSNRSDLRDLAQTELQELSEDLTQEILLKIQANLDTFQGRSKFTTWATKIAANHTISELRRARWRNLSLDALTEAGTTLQEILVLDNLQGSNPATESERLQVWQTVLETINNDLTERQRQTLAAVLIDQIPMTEVARLLHTNPNNVYKLLHDARLKLKRRLQQSGLEPEYILNLFSHD